MRGLRAHRSLVVFGLALVVFATLVPTVSPALPDVILTSFGLVAPAAPIVIVRGAATPGFVQPLALLSLARFRAPPVTLALA